jgi:hypothetical protein
MRKQIKLITEVLILHHPETIEIFTQSFPELFERRSHKWKQLQHLIASIPEM